MRKPRRAGMDCEMREEGREREVVTALREV